MMQRADYTDLAPDYAKNRPDYSATVLRALIKHTGAERRGFRVADVGAGTGIWTKMIAEQHLSCIAVEPNEAMREQGQCYTEGTAIQWRAGSAEETGLETSSVDWVTMASSFHWAKLPEALKEFSRILKPGGFLTVLWNPRHIEGNPLHERIEDTIYAMVPNLKRVSSGSSKHARKYDEELVSTGDFNGVAFFEASHHITMSKERYLGAWRSVYDIRNQAGPELFERVLTTIGEIIAPLDTMVVPYKTRAWTAQKIL
jgi:ubiquinone/menaquinone biosynthesis C-methylase UbiE